MGRIVCITEGALPAGLPGPGAGRVEVVRAGDLHTAVALLSCYSESVYGLLLDPGLLTARDLTMLPIIQRERGVRIWLLPATSGTRARGALAERGGALNWEEAAREIAALAEGPGTARAVAEADNGGARRAEAAVEKTVTAEVAASYDGEEPLLSAQEIEALLGAPQ